MIWLLIAVAFLKNSDDPIGVTKMFPTEEACKAAVVEITPIVIGENPEVFTVKCIPVQLGTLT